MSFSTRKVISQQSQDQVVVSSAPGAQDQLTIHELEYLLNVLKNVDLKGHQVEMFYNLVVKIQSQYVKQNKQ